MCNAYFGLAYVIGHSTYARRYLVAIQQLPLAQLQHGVAIVAIHHQSVVGIGMLIIESKEQRGLAVRKHLLRLLVQRHPVGAIV